MSLAAAIADRLTPRIVFFGPARSGKSSLLDAFLRVASGVDADLVSLSPHVPGELVPHLIRVENSAVAALAGGPVVVCDCDGQAASELLCHPNALMQKSARGAIADAVRSADALVLVVDAADSAEQVDATFRAFGDFLDSLEEGRTFGREVGGLPVFLTLAKCDALARPDDEPGTWLRRVEQREREVRDRFETYFGSDVVHSGSPFLAFGSIDLRPAATAIRVPPGAMFEAYADADGTFGVVDLVHAVLPAAREYRDRLLRAKKRLKATVGGVGFLVGAMLLGLAFFGLAGGFGPQDALAQRVRDFRTHEAPAAARLSDKNLAGYRKELAEIRQSMGFNALPQELQQYIERRLAEADAYRDFRAKFQKPQLSPADVRTREELDMLEAVIAGELAPPAEFAGEWKDTEAVRLRDKWKTDARLVREAEGQLHDWYRGLIRSANQLMLIDKSPDFGWRTQVETLIKQAAMPPFRASDAVPGSPTVPVRRGEPLTYAPAYEFDRLDLARRDWDETRDRLTNLRSFADALGLTTGPGTPPAVLELPEPTGDTAVSLALGTARLRELSTAYPSFKTWATANFPDPARRWLDPRLRAAFDTGSRHVRRAILERLPADKPEDWVKLANGLLAEPAMKDWGALLSVIRAWAEPGSPPTDPVAELATFLRQERFEVTLKSLEVTIPDDLLDARAVPAGKLVVSHQPLGGEAKEYAFKQQGDGTRDRPVTVFRFTPDGHPGSLSLRPGDDVTAALPLRSGGQDHRLVWAGGRSAAFRWDALSQPPVLEKVGPLPAPVRVPGVKLDGGPAVPGLLPDVKGK